jgi:hypothetical protein
VQIWLVRGKSAGRRVPPDPANPGQLQGSRPGDNPCVAGGCYCMLDAAALVDGGRHAKARVRFTRADQAEQRTSTSDARWSSHEGYVRPRVLGPPISASTMSAASIPAPRLTPPKINHQPTGRSDGRDVEPSGPKVPVWTSHIITTVAAAMAAATVTRRLRVRRDISEGDGSARTVPRLTYAERYPRWSSW